MGLRLFDVEFDIQGILYCKKAAVLIPLRSKKIHAVNNGGGRSGCIAGREKYTMNLFSLQSRYWPHSNSTECYSYTLARGIRAFLRLQVVFMLPTGCQAARRPDSPWAA